MSSTSRLCALVIIVAISVASKNSPAQQTVILPTEATDDGQNPAPPKGEAVDADVASEQAPEPELVVEPERPAESQQYPSQTPANPTQAHQETMPTEEFTAEPAAEPPPPHKFSFFTVTPEAGYVYFPSSEMTVNGFKGTLEPRNGMAIKLHLDFGGDGLAFELSPFFTVTVGGIDTSASNSIDFTALDLSDGLKSGSFQALGAEMGIAYRWKAGIFYPHIGLGFHGAYLMGSKIDFGTEIYGRLPVGFSIYVAKKVALVFESGFMLGVTGIKAPVNWKSLRDKYTTVDGEPILTDDHISDLQKLRSPSDYQTWWEENKSDFENLDLGTFVEGKTPEEIEAMTKADMGEALIQDQLSDTIRFGFGWGIDLMIGIRFP